MSNPVNPVLDGYRDTTPYITVNNAAEAIEFYKQAFDAVETIRINDYDGKIGHAEIKIGDTPIMLSDEYPAIGIRAPGTTGGLPVCMRLYAEDVDAMVKQAVAAGAKITFPVIGQFYGDHDNRLEDPFGHIWWIATHKEDLSPEELQKRTSAMFSAS